MKIVLVFFIASIFSCIKTTLNAATLVAALEGLHLTEATTDYLEALPIVDTIMGNRRTNVGCHQTLYPMVSTPLVVNCHPYNPTDVAGSPAPSYASHPLVVRYSPDIVREILPEFIRDRLDTAGPTCKLFLNVQDNPWNGTPIQLRAHAFSDFFPAVGGNYQGVNVHASRSDGTSLLSVSGSVHLHDGIASPSNFVIAGLDHTHTEDFYSIVTYQARTVVTRHILFTMSIRERFQDLLCAPTVHDRSPSFFSTLLRADYAAFLHENGIV
jgi:hypothetical protein